MEAWTWLGIEWRYNHSAEAVIPSWDVLSNKLRECTLVLTCQLNTRSLKQWWVWQVKDTSTTMIQYGLQRLTFHSNRRMKKLSLLKRCFVSCEIHSMSSLHMLTLSLWKVIVCYLKKDWRNSSLNGGTNGLKAWLSKSNTITITSKINCQWRFQLTFSDTKTWS